MDLFYQEKDSTIFCLTGSGLSYARITPSRLQWNNFGTETFRKDLEFMSVAADDSTVFVAGYAYGGKDNRDPSGGSIYFKSKGAPSFSAYYPSFRDKDSFFRLPYDVYVGDSAVFISLYRGLLLKNALPPAPSGWRAILYEKIDAKMLLAAAAELSDSVSVFSDSLLKYRDTLSLADTALFSRMRRFNTFDSTGDSTPAGPHYRRTVLSVDSDSVFLDVAFFMTDSTGFVRDTFSAAAPLAGLAGLADTLAHTLLPASLPALAIRADTLRAHYDTLITETAPDSFPPVGYASGTLEGYSLAGRDSLLFLGSSGGLLLASDRKTVFTNLLNVRPSALCPGIGGPVPEVSEAAIQPLAGKAFRAWIITTGDTVACSAEVPSTEVDTASLFPRHMDSLTTWRVLSQAYGVTDIAFFRDTAFLSYGHRTGIIKFYLRDSVTPAAETLSVWKGDTIPILDFLEPQLGINTLVIVPVDSARYEIWAGTDDGLYRRGAGASSWEYYEYKRPMDKSHGETYGYPTIIRPGYKSAKIAYGLSSDSRVTIEVYDFSMRKVRTVVKNSPRKKGDRSDLSQEDRWDGRDDSGRAVSPGVYYYKVSTANKSMFGKFMVFGAKDFGERE